MDKVDPYVPGRSCVVNSSGDLFFEYEARCFINQRCTIIKRTKAGLVRVSLVSDPKRMISLAQSNVDLVEEL